MKTEWRFIAHRISAEPVLVWPREIAARQTAVATRTRAVEGARAGADSCGPGPGERAEGREGRRERRRRRRDPHPRRRPAVCQPRRTKAGARAGALAASTCAARSAWTLARPPAASPTAFCRAARPGDRGGHRLRTDGCASCATTPRVRLLEKTNARYLTPEQVWPDPAQAEPISFIAMDVSFISATLVLPAVLRCARRSAPPDGFDLVVLVKAAVRGWPRASRQRWYRARSTSTADGGLPGRQSGGRAGRREG